MKADITLGNPPAGHFMVRHAGNVILFLTSVGLRSLSRHKRRATRLSCIHREFARVRSSRCAG